MSQRHPPDPGRNELCWCGSGVKFKKCHRIREDQDPTPLSKIRHLVREEFTNPKVCSHPDADPKTCGKVIKAHTVTRSTLLDRICDASRHVRSFHEFERDPETGRLVLHRVGWKQASTFTGFCSPHDNELFSPIEDAPFEATADQCTRAGYRAIAHEIYKKQAAIRAHPIYRDHLDRGRPPMEQRQIQAQAQELLRNSRQGLADLEAVRSHFGEALAGKDTIASCAIFIEGPIEVVATGPIHTDSDVNGNVLQDLTDHTSVAQGVAISMVATDEGAAVVLAWPRAHTAATAFVDSLLATDAEELPGLLLQIIFLHLENTYFSDTWWDGLDPADRDRLERLMRTALHDDQSAAYRRDFAGLLPWKVVGIKRN